MATTRASGRRCLEPDDLTAPDSRAGPGDPDYRCGRAALREAGTGDPREPAVSASRHDNDALAVNDTT